MTTATELAEEQAEAPPTPSQRAAELARMDPQRAMLELAWPGIVGNLTSTLGQAAIFAFVGHLGAVATAAVGASWQFLFLLFPVWRSLAIIGELPRLPARRPAPRARRGSARRPS